MARDARYLATSTWAREMELASTRRRVPLSASPEMPSYANTMHRKDKTIRTMSTQSVFSNRVIQKLTSRPMFQKGYCRVRGLNHMEPQNQSKPPSQMNSEPAGLLMARYHDPAASATVWTLSKRLSTSACTDASTAIWDSSRHE